jgi:hypothetical protein
MNDIETRLRDYAESWRTAQPDPPETEGYRFIDDSHSRGPIRAAIGVAATLVVLAGILAAVALRGSHGNQSVRAGTSSPAPSLLVGAEDGSVKLVSTTGTVERTVFSSTQAENLGRPVSVSVTGDGLTAYVGFESNNRGRYSMRIEKIPLRGGTPTLFATGAEPAVSRDGKKVAYIRESSPRTINAPVIVRDLVTRSKAALPGILVAPTHLSWSNDGLHLAISGDGNGFEIFDTTQPLSPTNPRLMFPPSNNPAPYWADAEYRGTTNTLGFVAFCPETIGCNQSTAVLSVDAATQQTSTLAQLSFGTSSLSFDSSGNAFAYIGLPSGTPLPTPLHLFDGSKCHGATECVGSSAASLIPVDTLLVWRNGQSMKLGTGLLTAAFVNK